MEIEFPVFKSTIMRFYNFCRIDTWVDCIFRSRLYILRPFYCTLEFVLNLLL